MQHLRVLVEQLRGHAVLVIGDVMLDEYLRGEVARISPEAPVPVLEVRARDQRLGGAANAAANIKALGGTAFLIGVIGKDETAATLGQQVAKHEVISSLVVDPDRPTSRKTRLVAQQQQIVRIDEEKRTPIEGAVAEHVKKAIDQRLSTCRAVVLSDYGKGVITAEIAQYAIAAATKAGLPVIVDPKHRDFTRYRGATVMTPNLSELEAACPGGGAEPARAAETLLPTLGGTALLVTRSADGMSLFRSGQKEVHVAALAQEVFDVTGAGDTVVATIALALGAGLTLEQAMELAAVAAAISVSKRGTSTVSPAELTAALEPR
ncbi:MAG: D-glycero-beta-D-manno-heptose-7-phosphate kinase [Deltaproteobacteria bacterium]|nr:D-glycero-beta-D-manno-heptose-7-phosphate kinase [Deltaproteobacteria bacterium]